MKKQISKLLLLIMVLAVAFSFTACGLKRGNEGRENTKREETSSERKDEEKDSNEDTDGTGDNKTTDKAETGTEDNKTETGEENKTGNGNTNTSGIYDSMSDYVNSSEVQDTLSTLSGQMSGSGMKIEITAEDNKMVYTYAYESLTKQDGMAESIETAMKSQDATFQNTANILKTIIKEANPSIVIRYVDSNGEIIYAKEYVAE